jgi:hypothetical protein
MPARLASTTYAVLAWLLGALALLHMATTWRLQTATAATRVWFFGAGLAMAEVAALNLLNRRYGRTAVGLRWTTRAFNLVMLINAVVGGIVTGASAGEMVFVLGMLGALLVLSLTAVAHRAA